MYEGVYQPSPSLIGSRRAPSMVVVAGLMFIGTVQSSYAQAVIEGDWPGAIEMAVLPAPLQIVLHFAQTDAGLTGAIDVPAQGVDGLPVPNLVYEAPNIRFELPSATGTMTFAGTIYGNVIQGTVAVSGLEGTFRLQRSGDWTAASQRVAELPATPPAGLRAVRVGDPSVDGSFIESYESEFELRRRAADGSEQNFGRWTDRVELTDRAGITYLRREVARYTASGTLDLWRVHLADPRTLEPSLVDQRFGPELRSVYHLEQDGAELRQIVVAQPDRQAVIQELSLSETPFDLSLYAILLLGFPREAGYEATFPVVGPTGAIGWETMRVDGHETLTLPDGRDVNTWKVSTVFRDWSVWFEESAPYIVKIVQRFPDGSEVVSKRVR